MCQVEGQKTKGYRIKGYKRWRVKGQNEKSVHWRFIKYFRSMIILQSDSLMLGVQPITCFTIYLPSNQILRYRQCSQWGDWTLRLPSNQILWRWEFSQSRVSSMGIQPLGFHESGYWGNQAFPRSSSRSIRFGKGEKSESSGHFSNFVIIEITLGKDCLKKMLIVYKAGPKVSEGWQSKLTSHLSRFIKCQEVLLEKKGVRIR
jgi:hypothetical protein